MSPKIVAPNIKLKSFSCPHCGALASQTWAKLYAKKIADGNLPHVADDEWLARVKDIRKKNNKPEMSASLDSWIKEIKQDRCGELRFKEVKDTCSTIELVNAHISLCYSCCALTLWRHKSILHPHSRYEIEPNPDMNVEIIADFNEARSILDLSPRGASALLRLCLQKLCKQLGLPGENLNDDIAALVKDGLSSEIQKALDILRVVGNESVHPGTMDMKDDRETAASLFELINFIATHRVTKPKELLRLYNKLPENKRQSIEARDGSSVD